MKSEHEAKRESPWRPTKHTNLVRYGDRGTFHVRAKVGGVLVRKSLNTNVESIALLRLPDILREARKDSQGERSKEIADATITFEAVAKMVLASVNADAGLKPRTKSYYAERESQLYRAWPDLKTTPIRLIKKSDCEKWSSDFMRAGYNGDNHNHSLTFLRRVFARGVELGVCNVNAAADIGYAPIRKKQIRLPNSAQFASILQWLDRKTADPSSAEMVRFLAYSGCRVNEARHVRWADVDWDRGVIVVKGDPETGTKNSEIRDVPMIPQMRDLITKMRKARKHEPPEATVMRIDDCRKALGSACQRAGIARMTHHDLRHLFATRCIESGVDIPTVSRWLGHKDGGALAMRVYGHLRGEHSASMAAKVSFATATANEKANP